MNQRYKITEIKILGDEHGPRRIRLTSPDGSWDEINPSDDGKVRLDDVIVGAFRQCLADIAERDARIKELECGLNHLSAAFDADQAELARLRAECDRLRIGHDRYEVARKLNVKQWRDALQLNMLTGKPFDQIIDELRPFYFPQDAARGAG